MGVSTTKPNDLLHRYILRRDVIPKVRDRIESLLQDGRRNPVSDARSLIPNASVILDVGANIGYVAFDFHHRWPEARIYCFEPTEQTFERLTANMGSIPEIECVRSAVSDVDGVAEFLVDNATYGGGANSLLAHTPEFDVLAPGANYRRVETPTVRLDTFCAERKIDHIDFLKLDIEGAEPLALAGASGLLADSAIDVILTEVRLVAGYEGGVLMHDLTARLAEHDYRPFGVYPFARSEIGQSLWGDALYLSPGFRKRLVTTFGAAACGFID